MSETKEEKPNPGSNKALDMGCLCPVLDNGHGRGYFGIAGQFVISFDCPLHKSDLGNTEKQQEN